MAPSCDVFTLARIAGHSSNTMAQSRRRPPGSKVAVGLTSDEYEGVLNVAPVIPIADFASARDSQRSLVSCRGNVCHYAFMYSALACFRTGMSGSASFQWTRKFS